ncbi:NADP-dependent oxidoreductase [Dyadobacter psychrotolerans]|uniref:NADP-dependent oxidoreductase n=1 Tax=Dyadobacter psychrotolerans TaxID=2541721 RepID=A0A4R5DZ02_9BACT|nr:NADP-dependent oxidoreductase [Dyadobacter psychrotolerans]TDE16645.1 NADP-dependent oxidoreductase [Dyadobacter psychrotolerans]
MKTQQIVLAARPKGMPDADTFRFEDIEIPDLQQGEVLLKGLYYSVDPYMRGRMNDKKSYSAPFEIDKPIFGGVVAEVEDANGTDLEKGDLVTGMLPWSKKIVSAEKKLKKIDASFAPPSYYLSILGMTGLTAYFGLIHIGKPKDGETVVVSGAAGAVGIVVGQIAKIHGCRVIGIAGSDEKIEMLKGKFGFDGGINYKTTPDMKKAIAKACPDGVDIYFDNVGGEVSDAVISNINFHARIPLCGQISLYNDTEIPTGPRVQPTMVTHSVLMQGFIVSKYSDQFPEGMAQLEEWVKEEKLKFTETIIEGFDQLPEAMLSLFSGGNTGKMVVKA